MKRAIVVVIDAGGRAHALVDKYLKSEHVAKAIAIPGNDLMLIDKNIKIFPQVKTTDISKIINICHLERADIVDVAQDDAVAVGLCDSLLKEGFKVFGPTRKAGQIEWDKAWARNFMKKFKIPHPPFAICKSQKAGMDFIKSQKEDSWYVKASGLAAGKGAIFAKDNQEAIKAIKEMQNFGSAGKTYLIEKYFTGEEFSSFALVNGNKFQIVGHAQDHKQVFDGNMGPNTGGMGCSSPPGAITKRIEKQIKNIFEKTVEGLVKIGRPYVGILYLGGIIEANKVYALEFKARWGDPEAQVVLPSIQNDYFDLVGQVLKGKIPKIIKDKKYRVVIAAASHGYPGDYTKVLGKEIQGLKKLTKSKIKLFGAGVKKENDKYVAAGGRLFYVLGEGKNVDLARQVAYNALSQVSIEGDNLHYRKDIGYRDLQRLYK